MNDISLKLNFVSNNYNPPYPEQKTNNITKQQQEAIQKIWRQWKIYRSFKKVREFSNITIPKQARKNRVHLFNRIYRAAGLPEAEQKEIHEYKEEFELLTNEEQELFETIVNSEWTLKHTTNSLKEIQQNGNSLKSLAERRRCGEEIDNAHTPFSDGNDDNIFFSCGLKGHSIPNFLNGASDVISMDINGLKEKSPELLSGLWTSGHFYAYRRNQQSRVISLGTTKYYVQYHTVKGRNPEEDKHLKTHIFARQDGTIHELSLQMGQEICLGANIAEETALRLIEFIRFAGPEFRQHILNNRCDVDIIENLMNIFFHPGIFEAHIPAEFPLDDSENIYIDHRGEFSYADTDLQTIKLYNAVIDRDYRLIQELLNSGLDINRVYQSSYSGDHLPLAVAVKMNDIKMVEYLMQMGADPNTRYYSSDLKAYRTPLMDAVSSENDSMIHLFLKKGAPSERDPVIRHISMVTDECLRHAIESNISINTIEFLFANQIISKEQKDESLNYCLLLGFKFNNLDIINFCLDNGADINFRSKKGSFFEFKHEGVTPLVLAIVTANFSLVKLAYRKGADIDQLLLHDDEVIREYEGYSPLMITIKEIESYEKQLESKWISNEVREKLEKCLVETKKIFSFLLKKDADLSCVSITGETTRTLVKSSNILRKKIRSHAKSKNIKLQKGVETNLSIDDARKYFGYALITSVDTDGDEVVFLKESIHIDGTLQFTFPNSMQKYSTENELLDTSQRVVSETLELDRDSVSLCDSSETFYAKYTNNQRANTFFHVKAQVHHFKLVHESLPKVKDGTWVKIKDINFKKVIDEYNSSVEYTYQYKNKSISTFAGQFLQNLNNPVDIERMEQTFLREFFGYHLLSRAIIESDEAKLRSLLELGVSPNVRGINELNNILVELKQKEVPFYVACRTGKLKLAKTLLDYGLKVDELPRVRRDMQQYASWNSLIILAVEKQNIELLKLLKEINFHEYTEKEYINTALEKAAKNESIEIVQFLLDIGANRIQKALSDAYTNGRAENFKLLIQHMDPEEKLENIFEEIHLNSPLHKTVEKSFSSRQSNHKLAANKMLSCLLEIGFETNVKDKKERSALSLIIQNNKKPTDDTYVCAEILLKHGSNPFERVSFKNKRQMSLYEYVLDKGDQQLIDTFNNYLEDSKIFKLYNAVKGRNSKTIDYLLQDACEDKDFAKQLIGSWFMVHVRDKEGITPLQRACRNGNIDVVQLLLSHKCINVDEVDRYGRSPISRAAENGHDGIIKLLLQKGADPSLCRKKTPAPLLIATKNGSRSTVKLLLSWGADTNATNQFGKKAIDIAQESEAVDLIQILQSPPKKISRTPNIEEILKPISPDIEEKFLSKYKGYYSFDIPAFISHLSYTYPAIDEIFDRSARVREGYSIREHTLRVVKNSDRQFYLHMKAWKKKNSVLNNLIEKMFELYPRLNQLIRVTMALHDIGKPLGPKSEQHKNTLPILRGVLQKLSFTENDTQLASALIGHDLIGEFVRPRFKRSIEETKNQLVELANTNGLDPKMFYLLLKVVYISDASSYPKVMKHYMTVDKKERIHPKGDKLAELEKLI